MADRAGGRSRAIAAHTVAARGGVLRIELLGPFRVVFNDQVVDLQARKSKAILGCLAMADDWKQSRERFHGLLWSEADGERAKASLRTAIYDIRGVLDDVLPGAFLTDKHSLWLDRDKVEVDLWQALDGAKQGIPIAPLMERERVTEMILADCESVDPSFRDWLTAKRQSLHTRLIAALEDSLRGYPIGAIDPHIEPLARAITRLDPTHEEAARALIRARAAAGDLGGAFSLCKALWDLLDTEFEIQPSKETQDLIAELRLAQPEGGALAIALPATVAAASTSGFAEARVVAPAPQRPAAARKLVINIGGFDASGVKPDNRYLISGFRQELSACLVRFREWSVRDQATMAAGAVRAATEDGEYIVDGSAFETSEGVRLVLMLRDAASNDYVWSERQQLSLENWFDTQQTIVRRLATALNVHLSAERLAIAGTKFDGDTLAHDMLLRGHSLLMNFTPNDWHKAQELFREVIRLLPTFAAAHTSLANASNIIHLAHPGVRRDRQRTSEALQLSREAVRLDPIDARSQLCLGWSYLMAHDFSAGSLHHGLALELNEGDPWTVASTALGFAFCGDVERSRACARRALALAAEPSPVHYGYQTQISFLNGDFTDAVELGRLAGGHSHFPAWRIAALALTGHVASAANELEQFVSAISHRWYGDSDPSKKAVCEWFLEAFPIAADQSWENLRRGLTLAGAPVSLFAAASRSLR